MSTLSSAPDCSMAINVGSSSIKTSIFHSQQRVDININFIGLESQVVKLKFQTFPSRENETYRVTVGDDLHQAAAVIMQKSRTVLTELSWPLPTVIGHRVKFAGFGKAVEPFTAKLEAILAFNDYLSSRHNALCLEVLRKAYALYPDAQQLMVRDQAVDDISLYKESTTPFAHDIIRRFGLVSHGYHGLAIKACLRDLWETHQVSPFNGVICQIGSGVSFSAVRAGNIVYNSMQFSACDGAVMHNRSGTQPPGLVLRLLKYGLNPQLLSSLYNRHSGIYGLASLPSNSTITVEDILCNDEYKDAKDAYLSANALELFKSVSAAPETCSYIFSGGLTNKHRWLGPELLYRARLITSDRRDALITQLQGTHVSRASDGGISIYLVDIDEQRCILNACQSFDERSAPDTHYDAICEVPGTSIGLLKEGRAGWGNGHVCLLHPYSDFPFDSRDLPEAFIFHGPHRSQFMMRATYARRHAIPAIFIEQGTFDPESWVDKKVYLDAPTTTVVTL
ncbi:hypothetical protein [Pseudomonas soli]|uniref:hypothetical protein n=1 Tax=Pseudomonas soli TaxID=1306993 RepID=UPI0028AAC24F|nr:hypothetical protein [Pseudomonas soli]MDW9403107.1 hypothetical protein [Pseudomonas soli]